MQEEDVDVDRFVLATLRTLLMEWRMEQRAYDTPRWAYTNSVPDQYSLHHGGKNTIAFYINCVMPLRQLVCVL